jgi:hypothetical protein
MTTFYYLLVLYFWCMLFLAYVLAKALRDTYSDISDLATQILPEGYDRTTRKYYSHTKHQAWLCENWKPWAQFKISRLTGICIVLCGFLPFLNLLLSIAATCTVACLAIRLGYLRVVLHYPSLLNDIE